MKCLYHINLWLNGIRQKVLCHDPLLLLRRIHKYSLRAPLVFPKYKEVIIPTRRPAFHKQFFSPLLVFSTPNWWMLQVTYIHSKYLKLSLHEMFLFHLRRHIWAQSQSGQFPLYRIWDTPGTSSVSLTLTARSPGQHFFAPKSLDNFTFLNIYRTPALEFVSP